MQPGDVDVETAVLDHRGLQPLRIEGGAQPDRAGCVEELAGVAGGPVGLNPGRQLRLEAGRRHGQHVAGLQQLTVGEAVRAALEERPGRAAQNPVDGPAVGGQELGGRPPRAVRGQRHFPLHDGNALPPPGQRPGGRHARDTPADDDSIEGSWTQHLPSWGNYTNPASVKVGHGAGRAGLLSAMCPSDIRGRPD